MKKQTKKDLEIINFTPEYFLDNLSENEKKEFFAACSVIYNNKYFKKICDELGTREILYTAKEAVTTDELAYGRGKIHGIATVYETMQNFNALHQQNIKKEESFDKHEII